ncbi:formylglycine-generating enzyme family protein [Vibrio pectenicida]|uniref:formylglycine-generating enzyme family protein n=1 Tax=Vibrio pectenicida TaxID=62763 RepID=UPI003B9D30DA
MKNRWLGLICTLPLLVACSSGSSIQLSSETVSKQQIETIVSNINARYPEATEEQKQKAAEAVVRAIENMVFVEGGSFDMGDFKMDCDFPTKTENRLDWSPDAECFNFATNLSGAQHLHKVTLDSYSISKYETSFLDMEWMRQISQFPPAMTYFISVIPMKTKSMKRTDDQYLRTVEYNLKHSEAAYTKTWQEAKDYCQWLGDISGLAFDLPTEAQWEYAARSRGQHYYYATNDGYLSYSEGWYIDPATGKYVDILPSEVNSSTSSEEYIGQWPANPLGLYGMSNGIREWVNDWYAKDYYLISPELNPKGPENGIQKVYRDGGGVKTFGRKGQDIELDTYSSLYSFRCSVQLPKPPIN